MSRKNPADPFEARVFEMIAQAERTGRAAQTAVRSAWADMLEVLKAKGIPAARKYRHLFDVTAGLGARVVSSVVPHFLKQAGRSAVLSLSLLRPSLDTRPTIDPKAVAQIIDQGDWRDRLKPGVKMPNPTHVAGLALPSLVKGDKWSDTAELLLPQVENARNIAHKITRIESLRIAHDVQLSQWLAADDTIIGFQVFSAFLPTSRPAHMNRSGTVYYLKPSSGQHGLSDMPRPPFESNGQIAYNCKCWLKPFWG